MDQGNGKCQSDRSQVIEEKLLIGESWLPGSPGVSDIRTMD